MKLLIFDIFICQDFILPLLYNGTNLVYLLQNGYLTSHYFNDILKVLNAITTIFPVIIPPIFYKISIMMTPKGSSFLETLFLKRAIFIYLIVINDTLCIVKMVKAL